MNKLTALFLILSVATVFADDDAHLKKTLDLTGDGTYVVDLMLDEAETTLSVNMTLTGKTVTRSGNGFWMGIGLNATGASMLNVDYLTCVVVFNNKATDACVCYDWSYNGTSFYFAEQQDITNVVTNQVGSTSVDTWSCSFDRAMNTGDSFDKTLKPGSTEGIIWAFGAANTQNTATIPFGHVAHSRGSNENGYLSITVPGESSGMMNAVFSGVLCLMALLTIF